MKDFYFEGSKLPFNCMIDADICKLKALKTLVIDNENFTGRLQTDYLNGIDHCIALLNFMRVCDFFLIKEEEPDIYRPIKNTSKNFCYHVLFNMQQLYWRLFK